MARKRRTKKLEPAELTLNFVVEGVGSTRNVVDLAQCLSMVNRKFFRQGYQYGIQKLVLTSGLYGNDAASMAVYRLPNTWVSVNAWTKAQAMWLQQQNDRIEQSGLEQTIASHRDFKIYGDYGHADGNYTTLFPTSFSYPGQTSMSAMSLSQAQTVSPTVTMDWEYSEVVLPNKGTPPSTEEYKLHMLGDDHLAAPHQSAGIILAYAESRNRPQQTDPNIVDVPTGGLYGEMFDVGEDSNQIITNVQEKNDHLPYLNDIDSDQEFYPGGANQLDGWVLEDNVSIVSGQNRTAASSTVNGFLSNCGLLRIDTEGPCYIRIVMAPGMYKGTMARPMGDVN